MEESEGLGAAKSGNMSYIWLSRKFHIFVYFRDACIFMI